ncbi:hypothetical protein B0I71DRAFT_149863 [Yarrowia lipolytica]|uniref:Uncharacterized protein n=1 Tax=Yarrowia lipolytica TaxID=4952 RepID=A0A371CFV6_YARLL|nr:hypothetical protein B0I71DRAFT_149863 [Yarrowia lipolytica]
MANSKSYISHLQTSTLEHDDMGLSNFANIILTCSLGFFTAVTCYLLFKWALQPILIQRGWIRMNTFQVGDDEASFPVPNESRNDDN